MGKSLRDSFLKPSVVSFLFVRRSKMICQSGTNVTMIQCFPRCTPFFCVSKKPRNPETQLQLGPQNLDHVWWFLVVPSDSHGHWKIPESYLFRSICKRKIPESLPPCPAQMAGDKLAILGAAMELRWCKNTMARLNPGFSLHQRTPNVS